MTMNAATGRNPLDEPALPVAADFTCCRLAHGPEGTARLAEEASGLLQGGEIILLYGKLGAGKTCFTQGLCRGLGVAQDVVSPTFTLVNSYVGRLQVHHLDFYRVQPGADLADIGIPDILDQAYEGNAVVVAEWPDLLLPELGTHFPRLELLGTQGPAPDDRVWHLRGFPNVPAPWAEIFSRDDDRPRQESDPC
jgi:tRNA threonylcarbamoyladenosine biosynthesis protein TsaE